MPLPSLDEHAKADLTPPDAIIKSLKAIDRRLALLRNEEEILTTRFVAGFNFPVRLLLDFPRHLCF